MTAELDLQSAIMASAWRDFVLFAAKEPEILRRYAEDTGRVFPPASRSPIERLVDNAAGFSPEEDVEAFVLWVTENLWGKEWAPEEIREAMMQGSIAE